MARRDATNVFAYFVLQRGEVFLTDITVERMSLLALRGPAHTGIDERREVSIGIGPLPH